MCITTLRRYTEDTQYNIYNWNTQYFECAICLTQYTKTLSSKHRRNKATKIIEKKTLNSSDPIIATKVVVINGIGVFCLQYIYRYYSLHYNRLISQCSQIYGGE